MNTSLNKSSGLYCKMQGKHCQINLNIGLSTASEPNNLMEDILNHVVAVTTSYHMMVQQHSERETAELGVSWRF